MGPESDLYPLDLVTQSLRRPEDRSVIKSLLNIAAGLDADPREITARQLRLLRDHRVSALVPRNWPTEPSVDLRKEHRRIAVSQLRLYALLEETVTLFGIHGIEVRVLKGLATSRLDYERPSQRHTGDVDLLVRREALPRVIKLLVDSGGRGVGLDDADIKFGTGVTITLPTGMQIDLHTRITRFSQQPEDLLFANPATIPGSVAFAFPPELRLVHAAAHLLYTAPGHRRLSSLADISAIQAASGIDLSRTREIATQIGVDRIAGLALRVERRARGIDTTDLDSWRLPSRLERMAFARAGRQLLMEHALAMSSLPRTSDRLRYVRQWTLPNQEQVALRGGIRKYFRRALPRSLGGQNLRRPR